MEPIREIPLNAREHNYCFCSAPLKYTCINALLFGACTVATFGKPILSPSLPPSLYSLHIPFFYRCLIFSILSAVTWALFVIPLSIAALLNALHEIEQERAPLVPSCHYSVPLLLVVLLTQVVAGAFVVYWFTKCCKCARTKKASRVATILSIIVAVLYAVIIISFSISVFVFVNKTKNSDSADSPTDSTDAAAQLRHSPEEWTIDQMNGIQTTIKTQSLNRRQTTDAGLTDQNEACIQTNSPPFLIATFYLVALLLFLVTIVVMTCYDYQYKRKHRNLWWYLKDTVRIYSNNESESDEETAL